jgi:hypothetical protein
VALDSDLRAQLAMALHDINQRIAGLHFFVGSVLPAQVQATLDAALVEYLTRQTLIQQTISAIDSVNAALDTLIAGGYPALPSVPTTQTVLKALQEIVNAAQTAVEVFGFYPPAIEIGIDLAGETSIRQPTPRKSGP